MKLKSIAVGCWLLAAGFGVNDTFAQKLISASLPSHVDPLITDRWHQEADPYLRYTPLDSLGNHCVVGCVGLALGEVMRYHRWPTDAYDWDLMLDEYIEGQFSEEQGDAVAHLLADCGKVVNTEYGTYASSAEIVSQPIALVDSFGYDRAIQLHYRDFYRRNEWYDMLRTELANGRPILLCASSATLSHAFICDGYNEDGLFHILWGNPTKDEDGWYDFDLLTPDQPKWYDKNNPERGLNLLQSICTGVQPPQQDTQENHVFGLSHIEAFTDNGSPESKDYMLNVVTHNLANIGRNHLDGRVALALTYHGEIVSILKDYDHDFELEEVADTSYTDTMRVKVISPVKGLGEYHIVPVFEDNGEWVEALTSVGTPNYILLDMQTDGFVLKDIKAASNSITLLNLDFPDTLVYNKAPEYTITLQNQGDTEYCGRIYFALVEPAKPDINRIFSMQGLYLSPGEATTRTFCQTPMRTASNGRYLLRIFTDIDLFTDSVVMLHEFEERSVTVVPTGVDSPITNGQQQIANSQQLYSITGISIQQPIANSIFISNRRKYLIKQ